MSRSEEASRGSTHPPVRRLDARIHPLTRSSIRAFGCLVVVAAVGVLAAPASSASSVARRGGASVEALVAVGGVPTRPSGARPVGPLAATRVISLGVALQPRDRGALAAFAKAVSMPHSPLYHHYLTPGEFAAEFGPSVTSITAVVRALRRSHLRVGAVSGNGLILPVSGTVRVIDAAFHTRLVAYRLSGGETGWAPVSAPRLSRHVSEAVSAVLGLDNLVAPHSSIERAPERAGSESGPDASAASSGERDTPGACAAASDTASASGGWTEDQLAQAYGLTGLYDEGGLGDGQTIGVLELEPFLRSDIDAFDDCFFGPGHTTVIHTVPIDGFDLQGAGTGESVLDLEMLAALAPGARLDVYEAPNTSFGSIDGYNAMVSADQVNIVSTSWGACETSLQVSAPGTQQIENYIFEEAAAQGQTVFASSGDTGSDDCAGTQFSSTKPERPYLSVDDPASQPYVVGVGGTSLRSDTSPLLPTEEQVWNDGPSGGGTGGGLSNSWASPVWQAQSGVQGTTGATSRMVPDVSSAADENHGLTFYSDSFKSTSGSSSTDPVANSGWATIGGTSIAAPTWAAIVADIASSSACSTLRVTAGGQDLGFVAPELYAVAASNYSSSFDDITIGNNDVFDLGFGYAAGHGFDLASGLGSPIITDSTGTGGLASALCAVATASAGSIPAPVVTGVAPAYGPTSGGNAVTVTGTGFATPGTSVDVEFGTSEATVDTVSATALTVTAPAAATAPDTSPASAAGAVEISVTLTDASGEATSRATVAALYDYVAENALSVATPSVSAIGPPAGNVKGGRTVTIWGSGFAGGGSPSVSFGGVASSRVRVLHDYEIRARVPAESRSTACASGNGFAPSTVCQVQVVVATAAGKSTTEPILPPQSGAVVFNAQGVIEPRSGYEEAPVASEYDYVPTPKVTLVVAGRSPASPVRVFGSGFSVLSFDWVNLGPASSVESEQTKLDYLSPTSIVLTPTAENATDSSPTPFKGGVSVATAGGLSNVAASPWTAPPSVTHLSLLGGPTAGGTEITISGSGLAGVRFVAFVGTLSPPTLAVASGDALVHERGGGLTVRTPADVAGPVEVLPCTATVCALARSALDTFVFVPSTKRSLVAITPLTGPASGGTMVTLFGRGVRGASAVLFGSAVSGPVTSARGYPRNDPYVALVHAPPGRAAARVLVGMLVTGARGVLISDISFSYVQSGPSPPRSVGVVRVGTTVVLHWQPPASTGGSRITSYTVVASTPGAATRTWWFGPRARAARLAGFVAGNTYRIVVTAWNKAHGRGAPAVVRVAVPAT
ncbi:MAG: IPT/TIG domain-containing protein [Acidimicrobiales bacterium]